MFVILIKWGVKKWLQEEEEQRKRQKRKQQEKEEEEEDSFGTVTWDNDDGLFIFL